MIEAVKRRLYKLKDRLYLEAKYLSDYGFSIGQPIRYEVDHHNGRITIETVNENKKKVAKTTQKTGKTVPVIDIKATEVKSFFATHNRIFVEIIRGKIIFSVEEAAEIEVLDDNIVSLDAVRAKKKVLTHYAVGVKEFAKAANCEQMTIFDLFEDNSNHWNTDQEDDNKKGKAITMLSLFSGSGTMDKAFLDQGYDIKFANDRYEDKALKDHHIKTYKHNIGDHIMMRDIMDIEQTDIPETDFVCAGIPCVTFSALNTKNNFRDSVSDLHPIVEKTLDIIKWSNAKGFLFENVVNFLKVKKGLMLQRLKEKFPEFSFVTKIIDATTLGSAQKRIRAFVLAFKNATPRINLPLVHEVRTVKDAFNGVELATQQDEFFVPTPLILERMKHVPQGGNIKNVPLELRAPKKTFSNYCQRLSEFDHAPTITHVQDDVFFHPTLERYLTVREAARLFSLPDEFEFKGSLTAKFEMLKNAVDYRVSSFLAKTIKRQITPVLSNLQM